jgi:hypothetical protein
MEVELAQDQPNISVTFANADASASFGTVRFIKSRGPSLLAIPSNGIERALLQMINSFAWSNQEMRRLHALQFMQGISMQLASGTILTLQVVAKDRASFSSRLPTRNV